MHSMLVLLFLFSGCLNKSLCTDHPPQQQQGSNENFVSIFNVPYKPFWAERKNLIFIINTLKEEEASEETRKFFEFFETKELFATKNFSNPNTFKHFFPITSQRYIFCWELNKAFQNKMKTLEHTLSNFDSYFEGLKASEKNSVGESLEIFQKRLKDQQEDQELIKEFPQALEETRKTIENFQNKLKEIEEKYADQKFKEKERQTLKDELSLLPHLIKELTNVNADYFRVIEEHDIKEIMKFPQHKTHLLPPAVAIVIDDFIVEIGSSSTLNHPKLASFLLPEAEKEGVICGLNSTSDHACHVAGIIANLAPFARIIPKPVGTKGKDLAAIIQQIEKNDYGARVINISAQVSDPEYLIKLCKKHIVVLAAGNDSGAAQSSIVKALGQSEDVRKKLLVVVNTMPDGQTISPTSNVPGYPLVSEATVAAPGTWVNSTVPTESKEKLHAQWKQLRKQGKVPSSEELTYERSKKMTGTSQATPAVTAVVLHLLSKYPKLSEANVVEIIKKSANREGELANRYLFGNGLADAEAAEKLAESYIAH